MDNGVTIQISNDNSLDFDRIWQDPPDGIDVDGKVGLVQNLIGLICSKTFRKGQVQAGKKQNDYSEYRDQDYE